MAIWACMQKWESLYHKWYIYVNLLFIKKFIGKGYNTKFIIELSYLIILQINRERMTQVSKLVYNQSTDTPIPFDCSHIGQKFWNIFILTFLIFE